MLPIWYLISTLHILPSLVYSYCSNHTVLSPVSIHFFNKVFLHLILQYILFIYSHLNSSFCVLFGIYFQNFQIFIFMLFLDFITHTFRSYKKQIIKLKNKTTTLVGSRQWSLFLLTFSRTILKPLLFISVLLFLTLLLLTLSLFHCGPNSFQLGYVLFLILHQVLKGLSNSLVLLYEFTECFFDGTQNSTIGRDYGQGIGSDMGFALLLESNAFSVYKRSVMKKKLLEKIITIRNQYLPRVVHQTILPSVYTSLTGVNTSYLDYGISTVLLSSFLERLLPLLISKGDLLVLRSCNLGFFSALQEGGVLCYHLVLELLNILQLLPLLFLCNPPSFGLFLCFGLYLSPCFLSCMLHTMGLYCLF